MSITPEYYPRIYDEDIKIKDMSKAYLKHAIRHIEKTGVGAFFLPALKEELRIKSIIKFVNTEPYESK